MAQVELVVVPYDSGQREVRMGRGPGYLVEHGLPDALAADGHQVSITEVESAVEPAAEIAVTFDLARSIAAAVRAARIADRLPLVLAGNCSAALGVVAGLDPARTGVLWLDAHGDLNTPETTVSGFLDGMALATLTGRCWRSLTTTVPGFAPLPDNRLAMIGARDLDPPEEALSAALGIRRLGPGQLGADRGGDGLARAVARIARVADRFYVHVDLDVLDPRVATSNEFAAPAGLSLRDVQTVVEVAGRSRPIAGAALTALDPSHDHGHRAAEAAIAIARAIAEQVDRHAAGPSSSRPDATGR
jgi:arginase